MAPPAAMRLARRAWEWPWPASRGWAIAARGRRAASKIEPATIVKAEKIMERRRRKNDLR
jgi:hypothetical protein